ncbi:ATP-binding protein [Pullulanibacillus sp. KACC 23026]|uniref:two-component system histidine kinase PnpS n=1 Tax=Pullulanibacillus sp. KACC 23026 TaxID=3028315 RepID=UPI0023B15173|nr:ATP-binding protein [Pullulanibacillus sp. KACC 23026]WEG13909.1 ATP-binding protein [Pullulanibacillus sp. KACC 23026]
MIPLILVCFLFLIILIRIISYYRRVLKGATDLLIDLTKGNFSQRIIASNYRGTARRLNTVLNQMARDMERLEKTYLAQEDQLKTLIENIGSGLVFIDADRRVILVNRSYRETFKLGDQDWRDQPYEQVTPTQEVNALILESFATEKRLSKTYKININIYRKYFDVSCAPVIDSKQRVRGVVVLFHDITELKNLEQMRKDFVANVSHELKTPITSIIGFSETLLDSSYQDRELSEKFLGIIMYESKRLQNLVHDLLELSKIEQPHYSIPLIPTEVIPVMNESLPSLTERAQAKAIDIQLDYKNAGIKVLSDPSRLKQIIVNLVNNAIAYTPQGGRVSIEVREEEQWGILEVSDTGIGIEKKELPRIFERFYRVDKARSRDSGGTGLGLAIVKHLVEAHGGEIEANSEVGKGSTFTIYFKKALEEEESDT